MHFCASGFPPSPRPSIDVDEGRGGGLGESGRLAGGADGVGSLGHATARECGRFNGGFLQPPQRLPADAGRAQTIITPGGVEGSSKRDAGALQVGERAGQNAVAHAATNLVTATICPRSSRIAVGPLSGANTPARPGHAASTIADTMHGEPSLGRPTGSPAARVIIGAPVTGQTPTTVSNIDTLATTPDGGKRR